MRFVPKSAGEFVPASHEDPKNPGVLKNVLATKATLLDGKVQMINWARLPPGKSFQSHYHEDMQEIFILVAGTAEMTVGDESREAAAGDMIVVEPREIHSMTNVGQTDVEYVVLGISTEEGGKTVVVEEN
jgi:mannose-6-phosphate isomerase-like protein (cupin superfamily)